MDLIFRERKPRRVLSKGIGDFVLKGSLGMLCVVIVKNTVKTGKTVPWLFLLSR